MPQTDRWVLIGMGCLFIILGIAAIIWGSSEEKNYYNGLSSRPDTREFMERWPQRPQFGALKIGGWIAIAVGLLMLGWGIISWLYV